MTGSLCTSEIYVLHGWGGGDTEEPPNNLEAQAGEIPLILFHR